VNETTKKQAHFDLGASLFFVASFIRTAFGGPSNASLISSNSL
jgi:hypothetical protein